MDSTLNADEHPRLAAVRSVRSWRAASPSWWPRALTLAVPIAALLAWCFLAADGAQARLQIDFDPMRPAVVAAPATVAASGAAAEPAPSATPGLPTLRITRQVGNGNASLVALVDDTWVRRGDVVAGHRVTALRHDSIELLNLADPSRHLTLRLNPVMVERADGMRIETVKATVTWPPAALEKK